MIQLSIEGILALALAIITGAAGATWAITHAIYDVRNEMRQQNTWLKAEVESQGERITKLEDEVWQAK